MSCSQDYIYISAINMVAGAFLGTFLTFCALTSDRFERLCDSMERIANHFSKLDEDEESETEDEEEECGTCNRLPKIDEETTGCTQRDCDCETPERPKTPSPTTSPTTAETTTVVNSETKTTQVDDEIGSLFREEVSKKTEPTIENVVREITERIKRDSANGHHQPSYQDKPGYYTNEELEQRSQLYKNYLKSFPSSTEERVVCLFLNRLVSGKTVTEAREIVSSFGYSLIPIRMNGRQLQINHKYNPMVLGAACSGESGTVSKIIVDEIVNLGGYLIDPRPDNTDKATPNYSNFLSTLTLSS